MAYASPMKIANGLVLDFTVDNADTAADTFLGLNASGEVTKFASVPRARVSGGGNLTEATSSVLTITGGSAAVLTSGLTIQVKLAGAAQSGYLSTTDWNTFNNKLGTSLTSGYVYVGNGSNVATGVAVSGDITISNAGVVAIASGVIVNADINATAAIAVSKLAAVTASRILGSDGSGFIQALDTATYPSLTELAYAKGVTSSIQTQLNNRLTVTLSSPTNGDVITYNGSAWVNSPSSTGVPVGGTTAQILRKIDVTNYNTEWHTLVAADITDVSATAAELNLLDGVTTTTAQFNFLNTVSGNVQDQLDSKQSIALTENNIWVGNASNIAAALAAGTNGYVLTSVSGVPTWVSPGVGGTVTSVAASGGTTGMSFTGSPVTTSGTLTLTGTLAIANGGTGLTALGTANQLIRVNAGATAIEYFTPTYITSPDFADNVFRISDNSDSTKKIAFEASGITTGTVRTFTAPNNSGTLALTSDLNSWLSGTLTANTDISRTVGNDVGTLSVYGNVIGLFNENTVSGRINSVQVTNNGIEITNTLSGGLFGINDTGVSIDVGSDATGDTYQRNAGGYLERIPIGTSGQVFTSNGTTAGWAAPSGGGGTWGSITGTLSSQTDLQTALDARWNLGSNGTFTAPLTFTGTTTNTLSFSFPSLGTTYSNVFMLNNPTAAAAGAQQLSPSLTLRGNGWKTNATAASQTVDFIQDVTPVQGAANPTGYMSIWSSINGAARSENIRFRNDGAVFLTGGSGFAANIFFGTAGDSYISRGTSGTNGMIIYGPSTTANIYTLSVLSNSTNYAFTGTGGSLALNGNWVPTIGAGNMYYTNTTGTINMTGTSSGNVFNYGVNQTVTAALGNYTGFYHNPTVTSITGNHLSFHATSGNVLLPTSSYINFNATVGTSGYGFRDNSGTMEWKNSGGAWAVFGAGGIGGSTGATDNLMLRADGTGGSTLQNSLWSLSDFGNLTIGTGSAITQYYIDTDGTDTNVDLRLRSKRGVGFTQFYVNGSSNSFGMTDGTELIDFVLTTNLVSIASAQALHIESQNGAFTLESYTDLYINPSEGSVGNIGLNTNSVSNWQSMDKGVFLGNRVAAPTTGIANGVALFAEDSNSSSEFYVMSESGAKVNISGLLESSAPESGTSFSLGESHRNKVVQCTNSGVVTVTVPSGRPVGWNCLLIAMHATGTLTLTTSGTTLVGTTSTTTQYETLSLVHLGSEVYLCKLG